MSETTPRTATQEKSETPEKHTIYDLDTLSAAYEFSDAADMYEALGAPEGFDALDPEAMPDADADSANIDRTEEPETFEILNRVDSLMTRRRSPAPEHTGTLPMPIPTPPSIQLAATSAAEPELRTTRDHAPEAIAQTSGTTPENTAPEPDAKPNRTGQAMQTNLPLQETPRIQDVSEKQPAEDDDLPILTDIILAEAARHTQTALSSGHSDDEMPIDARVMAGIAAQTADISQHAAETLTADISRICSERLAEELPTLIDNLFDSVKGELRAGIAVIVENALRDALAQYRCPTSTPDAQADNMSEI